MRRFLSSGRWLLVLESKVIAIRYAADARARTRELLGFTSESLHTICAPPGPLRA